MNAITKGTAVRQIITPVQGIVVGFAIDNETGERLTQVEYQDAAGETTSRFFKDGEIEATPAE